MVVGGAALLVVGGAALTAARIGVFVVAGVGKILLAFAISAASSMRERSIVLRIWASSSTFGGGALMAAMVVL